jgi:hypothetical protein
MRLNVKPVIVLGVFNLLILQAQSQNFKIEDFTSWFDLKLYYLEDTVRNQGFELKSNTNGICNDLMFSKLSIKLTLEYCNERLEAIIYEGFNKETYLRLKKEANFLHYKYQKTITDNNEVVTFLIDKNVNITFVEMPATNSKNESFRIVLNNVN